jgi:hypothetical protein
MHLENIINDFIGSLLGGNIWPTIIIGSLSLFLPVFIHLSKRDYEQAINSLGRLTMAFLAMASIFGIPLGLMKIAQEWKSLTTTAGQQ